MYSLSHKISSTQSFWALHETDISEACQSCNVFTITARKQEYDDKMTFNDMMCLACFIKMSQGSHTSTRLFMQIKV